jgi:hypothetical protein
LEPRPSVLSPRGGDYNLNQTNPTPLYSPPWSYIAFSIWKWIDRFTVYINGSHLQAEEGLFELLNVKTTNRFFSVFDPHWFQCGSGSSILGQCGSGFGFRSRSSGFDDQKLKKCTAEKIFLFFLKITI